MTFAEAAAAVARAGHLGAITNAQRDVILARLPQDFARLQVVEIRPALVARVPSLVTRHPLRAYDAIQLAAAIAVRETGIAVEVCCADGELVEAARGDGFRVIIPS